MRARGILLGAALATAAAAVILGRRALHGHRHGHGTDETAVAHGSWATCSAPSALVYDRTFSWLLGSLYRRVADDLATAIAAIDEPLLLEVGPGPGGLAVELARRHPGLRLTGLDVDPAMVERATMRARREGVGDRVSFLVGDVGALPFPDASFDLVTSTFSVHHWPDAGAGFAEIRRVLQPGGRAIVYDLPDRWGRLETKAPPLDAAARAGGFEAATVDAFRWPGPISVVRRLVVATGVTS